MDIQKGCELDFSALSLFRAPHRHPYFLFSVIWNFRMQTLNSNIYNGLRKWNKTTIATNKQNKCQILWLTTSRQAHFHGFSFRLYMMISLYGGTCFIDEFPKKVQIIFVAFAATFIVAELALWVY